MKKINKLLLLIIFLIIIITAFKLNKVDTFGKENKGVKSPIEIDIDTLTNERYNGSKSPILKISNHEFIIIGGKKVSPILIHKGSCEKCLQKEIKE